MSSIVPIAPVLLYAAVGYLAWRLWKMGPNFDRIAAAQSAALTSLQAAMLAANGVADQLDTLKTKAADLQARIDAMQGGGVAALTDDDLKSLAGEAEGIAGLASAIHVVLDPPVEPAPEPDQASTLAQ